MNGPVLDNCLLQYLGTWNPAKVYKSKSLQLPNTLFSLPLVFYSGNVYVWTNTISESTINVTPNTSGSGWIVFPGSGGGSGSTITSYLDYTAFPAPTTAGQYVLAENSITVASNIYIAGIYVSNGTAWTGVTQPDNVTIGLNAGQLYVINTRPVATLTDGSGNPTPLEFSSITQRFQIENGWCKFTFSLQYPTNTDSTYMAVVTGLPVPATVSTACGCNIVIGAGSPASTYNISAFISTYAGPGAASSVQFIAQNTSTNLTNQDMSSSIVTVSGQYPIY